MEYKDRSFEGRKTLFSKKIIIQSVIYILYQTENKNVQKNKFGKKNWISFDYGLLYNNYINSTDHFLQKNN